MKMSVEQIIKRVSGLEGQLGVWRTHWQELYQYELPRKDEVTRKREAGSKKGATLYDNTAMVSADTLAGVLHGMLTSSNQAWFDLKAADPFLNELPDVKEYLQGLTQRIHDVLNRSNFQTEVHELYLDLVVIGTAVMIIEEDKLGDDVVTFSTRFIDEVRLVENSKGKIEEVHRTFKWDARKIVEEFGQGIDMEDRVAITEKFGDKVWAALKAADTQKFEIIHSVYRKDIQRLKKEKFPFISQYIIKETKKEVKVGGFRVFPYVTPRWTKVAGETYGRSPGMNALPEAKTVNLMAKTVIKGAQKTVDPPLQAPDDGFSIPKRTAPGSLHYYRAGSKDRIEPIYNDARIDFGFEAVRDRQNQIRSAFFVDKLFLNVGDRATTAEVNQSVEEQFRFLGPMLGRQQHEFLKPMIERIMDIIILRDVDGKILGDMPEELSGADLDVVYTSPIARAQRIDQGQATLRAWESTKLMIEMYPEAGDLISPDEFVRHNWDIYGASQKVLRKPDEIEQIREAKAQAQQEAIEMQKQAQEAENIGKAAPAINQGE